MANKSRIRRKAFEESFQGVCLECNHRTQWFKGEDTAQKHIDEHIESKHSGSRGGTAKKQDKQDTPNVPETPDEPLRQQGADDVPPGGQDTGPRGDEAD
jgi:hypothetical protein